jgi:uncharacterized protein
VAVFLLLLGVGAVTSLPAQTFPEQPGPRDFVLDEANLIGAQDRQQIRNICDRLLTERRVPIVVVTISSLAQYGASDIEAYARALFDHWGIGYQDYNHAILLLVSQSDRKARIELGAAWAHRKDETARMIMQEIIIPDFKRGNYSTGILQGVQALDQMARELPVRVPGPWWQPWLFWGSIILGIAVAISLIRSGYKGWGWALLFLIITIIVYVLFAALRSAGERGSGAGAFGGGFGGGGGATGSW